MSLRWWSSALANSAPSYMARLSPSPANGGHEMRRVADQGESRHLIPPGVRPAARRSGEAPDRSRSQMWRRSQNKITSITSQPNNSHPDRRCFSPRLSRYSLLDQHGDRHRSHADRHRSVCRASVGHGRQLDVSNPARLIASIDHNNVVLDPGASNKLDLSNSADHDVQAAVHYRVFCAETPGYEIT